VKFIKKCLSITLSAIALLSAFSAIDPPMTAMAMYKDGWIYDYEICVGYHVSYVGTKKKVTVPKKAVAIDSLSDSVEELHIPEIVGELSGGSDGLEDNYEISKFCEGLATAKNLKTITISSENKQFTLKDGALYSRDLKMLLYYPIKKEGDSYSVPEKTKEIIILNSDYLKTIILPENLTAIDIISAKQVAAIEIPAKVSSISTINIPGNIIIDKDSKYFTKSKGVIFNKKKTKLIYYPPNKKDKAYTVPKSVNKIADRAFQDNRHLKTLTVNKGMKSVRSGSITKIKTAKISKNTFKYPYYPYYQSSLPKLKKLSIAKGNQYYKVSKNVLYTKDGRTLALYPSGKRDKSFRIPQNVKYETCYLSNTYLENLYVPSGFKFKYFHQYRYSNGPLNWDGTYLPKLKNIHVDKGNPHYTAVKGVLFNKDKKTLIYYPGGRKASSYTVPEGVTAFYDSTFQDIKRALTVKLPPTINRILGYTIEDYDSSLPEFSIRYKHITFLVQKGSTTHKTLKKYGFPYKFY